MSVASAPESGSSASIQTTQLQAASCAELIATTDEVAFQVWLMRRDAARAMLRMLTLRESQIAELVAKGLPNKSIAVSLGISAKTVEKHRAKAMKKMNVRNTASLVRLLVFSDTD